MKNRHEILNICWAYESAIGHALEGKLRDNPYPLGSDGFTAYEYGQKEGSQRYFESKGTYPIKE